MFQFSLLVATTRPGTKLASIGIHQNKHNQAAMGLRKSWVGADEDLNLFNFIQIKENNVFSGSMNLIIIY